MQFKIEMLYIYGWDDAGWTEQDDEGEGPMRFQSTHDAHAAIAEFLDEVRDAVARGDLWEDSLDNYRVVAATSRF